MEDLFSFLPPLPPVASPEKKRNRDKEGAGKSENSHRKHLLVGQALKAQVSCYLNPRYPQRSPRDVVIFDTHAGDGYGVDNPQRVLFGNNRSQPTPEVAIALALRFGVKVLLAEIDPVRRESLRQRFLTGDENGNILIGQMPVPAEKVRNAIHAIIGDCNEGPRHLCNFSRAFVVNDPNGCGTHQFELLRSIGTLMRTDYVVVSNQGWLHRYIGKASPKLAPHQVHAWQKDFPEWAIRLGKQRMAITPQINQSNSFRFRIFVIANSLADGSLRYPYEEISWKS